ncbi:MAG: hypothetical protein JKY27_12590, partial [Magnetovibrio sp.]|nr:hypothetical protein [Magnetovibrio sp.]
MDARYNAKTQSSLPVAGGAQRTVRVWDLPTRIFHWALVVMITLAWISSEADGKLFMVHVYVGTLLLGVVVFRIIWGVIGSR